MEERNEEKNRGGKRECEGEKVHARTKSSSIGRLNAVSYDSDSLHPTGLHVWAFVNVHSHV